MDCLFLSTNLSFLIVNATGWLPYGRPQRPINITPMPGNYGGGGGLQVQSSILAVDDALHELFVFLSTNLSFLIVDAAGQLPYGRP